MKLLLNIVCLLVTVCAFGQTNQMVDFTRAGSRVGMPFRANDIDLVATYGADPTGSTDSTGAFTNAIAHANPGDCIFVTNGTFKISTTVNIKKSGFTIRGSTNTVIVGLGNTTGIFVIGSPGDTFGVPSDTIYSGATYGSSNIVLTAAASFTVGTMLTIAQDDVALGTPSMPIINVHNYTHNIQEQVICTAIINGTNITLSDPLCWNFTNGAVVMAYVGGSINQFGLENITITQSNIITGGANGSYASSIFISAAYDCWFTNVTLLSANSYTVQQLYNCHNTWQHNTVRFSQGVGADHGGFTDNNVSWNLVADNIGADGLQPAIEIDAGVSCCVYFGNFFTNDIIDFDWHSVGSAMNLVEANICADYNEIDGYFGSNSHQTFLRNAVESPYIPLLFKRWTTHLNVVGNVLGCPTNTYAGYTSTNINPTGSYIVLFGYPNIGNNGYVAGAYSPPIAFNFPLSSYPGADNTGLIYPAPIWTLTNVVTANYILPGNYTNWIMPTMSNDAPSTYVMVFQDPVNTNLYYPTNGTPVWFTNVTTTAGQLNLAITLPTSANAFIGGQNAYQFLRVDETNTDCIVTNYDYFNKTAVNTTGLTNSLLYGNTAPAWWLTNSAAPPWPAVDPGRSTMVTMTPAYFRYLTASGGGGGGGSGSTSAGAFSMRLFIP